MTSFEDSKFLKSDRYAIPSKHYEVSQNGSTDSYVANRLLNLLEREEKKETVGAREHDRMQEQDTVKGRERLVSEL